MTRADVRGDVVALGALAVVAHARRGAVQRVLAFPAGIGGLDGERGRQSHVGGRFGVGIGDEDGLGGERSEGVPIEGRFGVGLDGEDGLGGREKRGSAGGLRIAENDGVGVVVGGIGGGVEDGDELIDELETGGNEVEARDSSEENIERLGEREESTVGRGGFEDVEHVEEDVSDHEAVFALRFLAGRFVGRAFVDRAVQEVVVLQLEELGEVVRDEG